MKKISTKWKVVIIILVVIVVGLVIIDYAMTTGINNYNVGPNNIVRTESNNDTIKTYSNVQPDHTSDNQPVTSSLANLNIVTGMERSKVEKLIASALDKQSTYSPYGNNLYGGVVKYTDGVVVIEVTYNAGAPAQSIVRSDGTVQGYPPVDETVKSFRIYKVGMVSQ